MDVDTLYDPAQEQEALALVLFPRYERMLTVVHGMVQSVFPELDDFRLDDAATRQMLALAAERVVLIDESTRRDIRRVLQQGQELGLSDLQIAEGSPADGFTGLRGLYQETYRNRSQTIARTELSTAQVAASLDRYAATGMVSQVELVEHTDTDADCVARNGQVVPLGQKPGLLHPNCRLALLPVVDDFVPTPRGPAPFPQDPIGGVEVVKPLGGSTGAELVKDRRTGALFVRKRGASPEHLREEVAADQAYQALGVAVPEARLYDVGGRPVKLARFVEGKSYASLRGVERELARQRVQAGFAVDALLANWDVAGLAFDNLLVDASGEVWRIDNGGALRFRAQGASKGAAWNHSPLEPWTLRDRTRNAQTAELFGDLTATQLAAQFKAVTDRVFSAEGEKALRSALPPEVFSTVEERAAALAGAQRAMTRLLDDRWKDEYTDGFAREWMGLRAAEIPQKFSKQLKGRGVALEDETGAPFDRLRGSGSHVEALQRYMQGRGGDHGIISGWMSAQAGSSWSARSLSTKGLLARQRDVPLDAYFWGNPGDPAAGLAAADAAYAAGLARLGDAWLRTWQQQHAFTYSLLEATAFPKKDAKAGTVTLVRTEAARVMQNNGFSGAVGETRPMQRGVAESTSLMKEVYIGGSKVVTSQAVPIHRVLGVYWQERNPGRGGSGFLGDAENEFVAMLEGLDVEWKKTKR